MTDENKSAETDDSALETAVSDAIDEVTIVEETENAERSDDLLLEDGGDEAGDGAEDNDPDSGDSDEGDEEDSPDGETEDEEGAADDAEDDEADAGDGDSESGDESGDDEDAGDESDAGADHLNDPIPEGTNKRTAQRIQSLISDVKELSTAREERDAIMQAIERTQSTPDQYAGALTVLKLYNSDSAEDKAQCLEIIRGMERDLAIELGQGQNHVKLSDYPDLNSEVEAGTLSEERAMELAAVRERDKHITTKKQQRDEQTQGQRQTQELVDAGKKALNDLGQELTADPAYAQLYPQFTALLQTTLRHVHPSEWGEVARDTYSKLKAAIPANTNNNPQPKPKNQPLRPKSGSSSSNKKSEAASALDALDGALSSM